MGEFQVTVDGKTIILPRPFFVIATQNPIEMDGTFPLPEAQLDRFLMRIDLGYPTRDEEVTILERFQESDPLETLAPVVSPERITGLQRLRAGIVIAPAVRGYIADLAAATRRHSRVRFGVSPRGSIGMMRAAQGLAMLRGRDFVLPDDIKELAEPVLLHRIILRHEERTRGASAKAVLEEILAEVPVPVSG
jgi:MoxR-like ATPase